jgi:SAM-dependent methyltransferase
MLYFSPKTIEEGKETVVGGMNGVSMEERWEIETPRFAKVIKDLFPLVSSGHTVKHVLDYGCGIGRLSKEILKTSKVKILGVDMSPDERLLAPKYVNHPNFSVIAPEDIPPNYSADIALCIYVLQHTPAIDLRETIQTIYDHLKTDGVLVYCGSDHRMAARFDAAGFFDDRFLGVNVREELECWFKPSGDLFTTRQLKENPTFEFLMSLHHATVYRKR